jgi:hypothetical protein
MGFSYDGGFALRCSSDALVKACPSPVPRLAEPKKRLLSVAIHQPFFRPDPSQKKHMLIYELARYLPVVPPTAFIGVNKLNQDGPSM